MLTNTHTYPTAFFEYLNAGSLASASVVAPVVFQMLKPRSLLDVGCGAGAWCKAWSESGIDHVIGIDGDYVDREKLLIPAEDFHVADLAGPFNLKRTFDLVTSLEVAEHIQERDADTFIDNLIRHGKVILFSAAVPGQGGEFHVNEQPLNYWRSKFASRGYQCFDPLRAKIVSDKRIEPWYRYNTLLYASDDVVSELPHYISISALKTNQDVPEIAPVGWRVRKFLIRCLPDGVIRHLVRLKHAWIRRKLSSIKQAD